MKRQITLIFFLLFSTFSTTLAQGGLETTVTSTARFRSGPGTDWRIQATLSPNTPITLDARDGTNNFWVRGKIADGTVGWLASEGVAASVDQIAGLPIKRQDEPFTLAAPAAAPAAAPQADDSAPAEGDANAQAAAPALPAPAVSSAPVTGFSYGGHVAGLDARVVNYMRQAGMTWVKKQVRYLDGQDASSAVGNIGEAHANGFRVVLGVVGNRDQLNNPGYNERYAAFVGGLAAAGADAIEVWNEPNIDREWVPGQVNPAAYTQLLAAAYNSIKANNPNTLVISGAPAPTGFFGGCSGAGCDDNAFIAGMAAAVAANFMDCVGVHYNEGILPPTATSGDPRGNSGYYTRYYPGMVNTYYNAFGGRRPLCFTELGYLTPEGYGPLPGGFAWASNVTVVQQAAWLDQVVSMARNSGRVRLLIVWNVNFTGYGADPMGGYAMIRPDGSCPACAALGS